MNHAVIQNTERANKCTPVNPLQLKLLIDGTNCNRKFGASKIKTHMGGKTGNMMFELFASYFNESFRFIMLDYSVTPLVDTASCNFVIWPLKQSHYRPGQALRFP